MAETVSWVLEVVVKHGKLGGFTSLMEEMVEFARKEPGTLVYEWFISRDSEDVHIYERYADSAAAAVHLAGFGQRWADRFLDAVEPTRFRAYGAASEDLKGALSTLGCSFLVELGGFAR